MPCTPDLLGIRVKDQWYPFGKPRQFFRCRDANHGKCVVHLAGFRFVLFPGASNSKGSVVGGCDPVWNQGFSSHMFPDVKSVHWNFASVVQKQVALAGSVRKIGCLSEQQFFTHRFVSASFRRNTPVKPGNAPYSSCCDHGHQLGWGSIVPWLIKFRDLHMKQFAKLFGRGCNGIPVEHAVDVVSAGKLACKVQNQTQIGSNQPTVCQMVFSMPGIQFGNPLDGNHGTGYRMQVGALQVGFG